MGSNGTSGLWTDLATVQASTTRHSPHELSGLAQILNRPGICTSEPQAKEIRQVSSRPSTMNSQKSPQHPSRKTLFDQRGQGQDARYLTQPFSSPKKTQALGKESFFQSHGRDPMRTPPGDPQPTKEKSRNKQNHPRQKPRITKISGDNYQGNGRSFLLNLRPANSSI